jgi:hypothetical protein
VVRALDLAVEKSGYSNMEVGVLVSGPESNLGLDKFCYVLEFRPGTLQRDCLTRLRLAVVGMDV